MVCINTSKKISKAFQVLLNISLIIVGICLVILLFKEIISLIQNMFYENVGYKEYFKNILNFFLYFEFTAMIVKYFEEEYHFPLRYFMYIGITATIRLIIIDHESGVETLLFCIAIMVLVISYVILKINKNKKVHFKCTFFNVKFTFYFLKMLISLFSHLKGKQNLKISFSFVSFSLFLDFILKEILMSKK